MEFSSLRKQFWGRHLGARGYFCCSSGNVTDEVVASIANQGEDSKGSTHPPQLKECAGTDHEIDPMRLAYLINQYPQPSHSFIRREIAALEARGIAVLRYTLREGHKDLVDAMDEAERRKTRVVLKVGAPGLIWSMLSTLTTRPLAFARAAWLLLRVGRRSERGMLVHLIYLAEACILRGWFLSDGVQHVHAHFGTNSTMVAMLCEALGGPPYSFTAHGPEEFDKPLSLALSEKVGRAAFVVTVSEFGRSQLYRWVPYRDWPKIHIVRCGVDVFFLSGELIPPPTARRLVCVGRLVEQKGQVVLVEAAARLRAEGAEDFEVILVGDGPMRGEIEALIEQFGLGGTVRLAGWQSNATVRELIRSARAMVLPSFAEGLPVVLMEALALGRPVISTYVAGIPELIQPGMSGWLIPPGSIGALAQAMGEALKASNEQLERMGRAGASRVAECHDTSKLSDELVSLFRESEDPLDRVPILTIRDDAVTCPHRRRLSRTTE